MKTFTQLKNLAGSLSTNVSTTNLSLFGQLINDRHRYAIQKYFDNERTVTLTTIGGDDYTLTGTLAIGAVTATLTSAWTYPTYYQLVNFSGGEQRNVLFTYNSTTITWADALTETATTAITTLGVQNYNIPADVSKIKNDTINVGQLKYQPTFIQSIQDWDNVNFLPYTSDIPNYCFIYNGTLRIFPIPSTTGNIITFNYKTRTPDMTYDDYTTGTLASGGMVVGSTSVTGLATAWSTYPQNTNIQFLNLYIRADVATGGDGIWYPILKFTSATALTLALPVVNAPSITASTTYTIGQMPLLQEDFHDMLVYGALKIYHSSVVADTNKFKEYDALEKERLLQLADYAGTKQVNVDLGSPPESVNPNLFLYAQS